MSNFANINNALNSQESAAHDINISVVSIAGEQTYNVLAGSTVGDIKRNHGLGAGMKIVDAEGNALSDNTVLNNDMELFVATPKKNG